MAAGYRVYEIPMERECRAVVADARRGKNMFALGMLCNLYSLDLDLARDQVAITFGKKEGSVINANVRAARGGLRLGGAQSRFQVPHPGHARRPSRRS